MRKKNVTVLDRPVASVKRKVRVVGECLGGCSVAEACAVEGGSLEASSSKMGVGKTGVGKTEGYKAEACRTAAGKSATGKFAAGKSAAGKAGIGVTEDGETENLEARGGLEFVHPIVGQLALMAWMASKEIVPLSRLVDVFVNDVTFSVSIEDGVAVVSAIPAVYVTNRVNAEGSELLAKVADLRQKMAVEEGSRSKILGALEQLAQKRQFRDETPADAPMIREGYEREVRMLEENLVGHDEWLAQVENQIAVYRGQISGLEAQYAAIAAAEVPRVKTWRFGLSDFEFGVRGAEPV